MADVVSRLPAHERRRLEAVAGADVEELARRRVAGEPLQYLEGTAPFTDFDVVVDERVLIPRPETEGLFELVVATLTRPPRTVVDLGTGSGVLAIAFARAFPDSAVHAVDVSAEALEVAAINAARNRVDIRFHHGDLFEALPGNLGGRVDLIVSNPPYVAQEEWAALPEDVKREPPEALIGGPQGTEVLEKVAATAGEWLAPGGMLACEIGETQGDRVRALLSPLGPVEVRDDLAGRPRYAIVLDTPL